MSVFVASVDHDYIQNGESFKTSFNAQCQTNIMIHNQVAVPFMSHCHTQSYVECNPVCDAGASEMGCIKMAKIFSMV